MAMVSGLFVCARVMWRRLSNQTGGFDIPIFLTLFVLWIVLNMLDIIISLMATRAGAMEIGLLYQVSGTFLTASINKMLLAILIGVMLAYLRKNNWLCVLNLGILFLCIYNGHVLLMQLS